MTAHMLNLHLHENIEEDYYISSFFPADVQQHLVSGFQKHIIHRVYFHYYEQPLTTSNDLGSEHFW